MKRYIAGPLFALVLALAFATALFFAISYAYAMECPSDGADSHSLRLESVTIDGVEQRELEAYYKQELVSVTIAADKIRSDGNQDTVNADHVVLYFRNRVAGPGSYDEVFVIDTGDR